MHSRNNPSFRLRSQQRPNGLQTPHPNFLRWIMSKYIAQAQYITTKDSQQFQRQHAKDLLYRYDRTRLIIKDPTENSSQEIDEFGTGKEKKKRELLRRRRHCGLRTLIQLFLSCRRRSKFKIEISQLNCSHQRKTSPIRKEGETTPEVFICFCYGVESASKSSHQPVRSIVEKGKCKLGLDSA